MFKFIHCADLHLDSPLLGLAARDDAPQEEIRGATRRALENLVNLAISERVSFVVIAGDVYDGDWDDYNTGLFFHRNMVKLGGHGIPVFLIRGNHDAASQISRRLTYPANVTEFSTDVPQTVRLEVDGVPVAIHGQGFAQRAVTDNLALAYPDPIPGALNVGLLHTCAEGSEGHEPYAPCRISELVDKGYEYWALGHIHKRQILHEHPYVVFPGNIQGRHIREEGDKGCTLVMVEDLSSPLRIEHKSLDVLRWFTCEVDLSSAATMEDFFASVKSAIEALADAHRRRRLALRIVLRGATPLHGQLLEDAERFSSEIEGAAYEAAGDGVWIEKVKFRTEPVTGNAQLSLDTEALFAVQQAVLGAASDDGFLDEFVSHLKGVEKNLRQYLQSLDATTVESLDDVRGLLPDAQSIIQSLLSGGGRAL